MKTLCFVVFVAGMYSGILEAAPVPLVHLGFENNLDNT